LEIGIVIFVEKYSKTKVPIHRCKLLFRVVVFLYYEIFFPKRFYFALIVRRMIEKKEKKIA